MNDILMLFGKEPGLAWEWTRAVWLITMVNTFQWVGVSMVVYLAGLQAIQKTSWGRRGWRFGNGTIHVTIHCLCQPSPSIVLNIIEGLAVRRSYHDQRGPGYASHSLSP
jgi:raffinose/stachyose/melibiose transport system permease protein